MGVLDSCCIQRKDLLWWYRLFFGLLTCLDWRAGRVRCKWTKRQRSTVSSSFSSHNVSNMDLETLQLIDDVTVGHKVSTWKSRINEQCLFDHEEIESVQEEIRKWLLDPEIQPQTAFRIVHFYSIYLNCFLLRRETRNLTTSDFIIFQMVATGNNRDRFNLETRLFSLESQCVLMYRFSDPMEASLTLVGIKELVDMGENDRKSCSSKERRLVRTHKNVLHRLDQLITSALSVDHTDRGSVQAQELLSSNLFCDACGHTFFHKKRGRIMGTCTGCDRSHYCSRTCQKSKWKEHRPFCSKIRMYCRETSAYLAEPNVTANTVGNSWKAPLLK